MNSDKSRFNKKGTGQRITGVPWGQAGSLVLVEPYASQPAPRATSLGLGYAEHALLKVGSDHKTRCWFNMILVFL